MTLTPPLEKRAISPAATAPRPCAPLRVGTGWPARRLPAPAGTLPRDTSVGERVRMSEAVWGRRRASRDPGTLTPTAPREPPRAGLSRLRYRSRAREPACILGDDWGEQGKS
jgi:hypothetical protein